MGHRCTIFSALLLLAAGAASVGDARAARLGDRFTRGTGSEELLEKARQARWRSELALAASLLDEAEAVAVEVDPRIIHERGLLLREGGDRETAVGLLRRAADLDPKSEARVDLAGVLVALGRWPEAVVVLRRAFDERGTGLQLEAVSTDTRFVQLKGFEPYEALIARVREDQAGMLGRLQMRLESIETAARKLERGIESISAFIETGRRLANAPATALVVFVLLAFLFASGLAQMRVLAAPWTMVVGTLLAAAAWVPAARVVGTSDGWWTVGVGASATLVPVAIRAVFLLVRPRPEPVVPALEVDVTSVDRDPSGPL